MIQKAESELTLKAGRISSIDILRGLIMALMALDHTRDFFHIDAFRFAPEDLTQTNAFLFFTRWITHYCAPLFVLLAGVSSFLFGTKSGSKKEFAAFLLSRGIILILLEMTVIRFAWRFYIDYHSIGGLVIWALGWSMVFMSFLIFLPRYAIAAGAITIIFLHNLLDYVPEPESKSGEFMLAFFHQAKYVKFSEGFGINILYPVLPMIGIMMLGYSIGYWYRKDYGEKKRRRNLLFTGFIFILLFVIIRFINVYGDPDLWAVQADPLFTLMSFLNCRKYPMSLLYILMTVGPGLIILSLLEKLDWQVLNPFRIIGRVPLFYYIIHLFLIHALAIIIAVLMHLDQIKDIITGNWYKLSLDYGYRLPVVYLVWLIVLIILYFISRKYEGFQKNSNIKWLRFI